MQVIQKSILYICLCVGAIFSNSSFAANSFPCAGTIEILGVHSPNNVILKLSGMNTLVKICDLESEVGNSYPISTEQCKISYSTLLAARAMNKTMTIYFDNIPSATSCSNFSNYELATARNVFIGN